uniref:Uncharacterized protein n=1 Tax=Onchocerca volvulus TaxID=6282 RepID=A0A8R1TKE7_ONCVO
MKICKSLAFLIVINPLSTWMSNGCSASKKLYDLISSSLANFANNFIFRQKANGLEVSIKVFS